MNDLSDNVNEECENKYVVNEHRPKIEKTLRRLSKRELFALVDEISREHSEIPFVNDSAFLAQEIVTEEITFDELDTLLNSIKDQVVDEIHIKWIQDSLRVSIWFNEYLQTKADYGYGEYHIELVKDIEFIDFVDYTIGLFDTAYFENNQTYRSLRRIDIRNHSVRTNSFFENILRPRKKRRLKNGKQLSAKRDFIKNARKDYLKHCLNHKELNWIDENNIDQIEWAYDYLTSQRLLVRPQNYYAINHSEKYAIICASLDCLEFNRKARRLSDEGLKLYKKDTLNKFRNAWSQKKYRDKKDFETAQEYLLTLPYRNKLKNMAKKEGVDTLEYLKYLIDQENEKD